SNRQIYISFLFVIGAHLIFFLPHSAVEMLTAEDGVVEIIGATFFLIASVLFFKVFYRTGDNYWFILLSILFFFGFGEEISWGQRIFDVETPAALKELNAQQEINIHNLWIFQNLNQDGTHKTFWQMLRNFETLFLIFCLGYCVVIPVVCKVFPSLQHFVGQKVKLPIAPLFVSALLVIVFLFWRVGYHILWLLKSPALVLHGIAELKESLAAFCFFVFAYCEYEKTRSILRVGK